MDTTSIAQAVHTDTLDLLDIFVEEEGVTHDDDVFFQIKSVEDYHKLVSSITDFDDVSMVNLSDIQLSPAHISLLSKVLNFCHTPYAANLGYLDWFHKRLK